MCSKYVLLFAAFSLVQGSKVYDVTAIYEVEEECKNLPADDEEFYLSELSPVCNTGRYSLNGRIHARTNALGLAANKTDDDYNVLQNTNLPNITWQTGSGTGWKSVLQRVNATGIDPRRGEAYKISKRVRLAVRSLEHSAFIYFTSHSNTIENKQIFSVIRIYTNAMIGPQFTVFRECFGNTNYQHEFNVRNRDGSIIRISCHSSSYDHFQFNNDDDYLSFEFLNKKLKIYTHSEEEYKMDTSVAEDDLYFSISIDEDTEQNSITFAERVLLANNIGDELVSSVFYPQTIQLCLAIVLYSSIETTESVLDMQAENLQTSRRYHLGTITNVKLGWNINYLNTTLNLFESTPTRLIVTKVSTAQIHIYRITSCSSDGQDVFELPSSISIVSYDLQKLRNESIPSLLPVYTSFADRLDPVRILQNVTNHCWNGGVLTSAGCACVPGFSGSHCEIGCGRNRFGQDCEGLCSIWEEECKGLLMCTMLTNCHCAPGYFGDGCNMKCSAGWYGNDCLQHCGKCSGGTSCDIYTGECVNCEYGFLTPYCKQVSVYYGSEPEVESPDYGTIIVSFDPTNYITVKEPPRLYQIQFKEKGGHWRIHTSKYIQTKDDVVQPKISENIEGLGNGIIYEVCVLLMDSNLMKYSGNLVKTAEILTKCDIPEVYDYKVRTTSTSTSLNFSWSYINENTHWCPVETFEVSWKEGWKWQTNYTTNNYFTLMGLLSGLTINFKVRANTTGGVAPFSNTVLATTLYKDFSAVRNLHVETSLSTSADISWEAPRGTEGKQLQYTITYKCVDQPACSPGCQNVSEGQLTHQGTSITLNSLVPFTQYLVTVAPEDGIKSSIYVGTAKVVPTEVPILSNLRPVKTNTTITVFWDQGKVCSGYLLGYNYQLIKASEDLKILASGFTKDTNASFYNLTASTEYSFRVFTTTAAGWNPQYFLSIDISTSATVPEAVRNLTIYKRGRGMLGLRWAEPRATYGQLKSFTVSYTLGQEVTSSTIKPTQCIVWPNLYCHTIEDLKANRKYNITVSARNAEVEEDGNAISVIGVTKESSPSVPVNLKLVNSSSTSVHLQWDYPDMANGVLRSFLISVEETEKFDQDSCCQIYPFIEILSTEEIRTYNTEVSGLHPASTYYVSVSAKTVSLGSPQLLVVQTKPPHMPFTILPQWIGSYPFPSDEATWLPQQQLPEVNNSEIYNSLVKGHLLLAVLNETMPLNIISDSGVTDQKLNSLLQERIGKPFFFIAEYTQIKVIDIWGALYEEFEDDESIWGHVPTSYPRDVLYKLVAVQVGDYNGIYNVDLRYSQESNNI